MDQIRRKINDLLLIAKNPSKHIIQAFGQRKEDIPLTKREIVFLELLSSLADKVDKLEERIERMERQDDGSLRSKFKTLEEDFKELKKNISSVFQRKNR